ncbi:hypothetical protein [Sulfobacillus harzensis]|uniref:Uncharacterized protein n=1 Tax=Sulfobacillus harzensis TaxID=2729629 RepID=A0A7Y0L4Z4_9FIRM|nr:hypothetical protein [Sulfobacillus harzensis]NMP23412.1 hypothetical protein [Sulfobacillus harzensis]
MTRWTKCAEKTCHTLVLAVPGVPRRCPRCQTAHRQALYERYLHREEAPHA